MQNVRERVRTAPPVASLPSSQAQAKQGGRSDVPFTQPRRPVLKRVRRTVAYPLSRPAQTAGVSASAHMAKAFPKKKVNPLPQSPGAHELAERTKQHVRQHQGDERFRHEMKEMRETQDLRQIDDDVEAVATLLDWRAVTHIHQEKSARWYATLAVGVTSAATVLLFMSNFIGAITVGFAGFLMYITAQHKPPIARYRIMVDGVAVNTVLYHYRDLAAFNVVYHPGETKTVILRSKHLFTPHIHLEIGDMDPVAIRDVLLEFLPEDQDMEEPLVDILARRLGY